MTGRPAGPQAHTCGHLALRVSKVAPGSAAWATTRAGSRRHSKRKEKSMTIQEETDPQDSAALSDSMDEPKPVQEQVFVRSVYEGLVAIGSSAGKLYGTRGKRADMMKFDLTAHSAFVGNSFIVKDGKVRIGRLETATKLVVLDGLPWLTPEEGQLDPVGLFDEHYRSRPNGSERYMASNFKAKELDEMTDDEVAAGMPRAEARVRLEAWILCASLSGALERYVKSQANWRDGSWWWTPDGESKEPKLVVKTDWWLKPTDGGWKLELRGDGHRRVLTADNAEIARLGAGTDPETQRAVQMAMTLKRLAKSLAQEAFRLEAKSRNYDIDPIVCEVNRAIEYIETGRERKA